RADGKLEVLKLPSTPENPAAAILEAIEKIVQRVGANSIEVRHGTTVATNALLERKGARVAFVTTARLDDTLAISRQVQASQVESVAVSLLFSFANPTHERAIESALASLGLPLSLSHQILPEFREFERASTVALNAYLSPSMASYIGSLEKGLAKWHARLSIMQSSGGILSARSVAREPVRTILSGPAGGVIGALGGARAAGIHRVISFDMGGTSTDVALLDATGEPPTSTEGEVAGLPISVPMLDIHTAGAGGGSLAWIDA